jgi:hypothetical protein
VKYEQLAKDLMFGQVYTKELEDKYGLQFRKGKSAIDIKNAIHKAGKNGFGKVEFELSMLELYLKDVLKKVKPCSTKSGPTTAKQKPNLAG